MITEIELLLTSGVHFIEATGVGCFKSYEARDKAFYLYNEIYAVNPEKYGVKKMRFQDNSGCRDCGEIVMKGIVNFKNENI